ncbi:MAG TPA: CpsD/CapB family tyrosine-protein kinase [Tabrizicola sp.]|nr:CpsD/CapB family tyrosine-protein kinase [Tabrizicola sp.]
MERIQQAIAKARATREGKAEQKSGAPLVKGVEPDVTSKWEGLTEMRLEPEKLEGARIIAHQPGAAVKAFDLMRTNLLKHLRENGWKRVAITSPTSGCGKTTVCLNLAFSLARQSSLRIMVLEMDLRRPAIVSRLGLHDKMRFADVLSDEIGPENGLLRIGKNLMVGASAHPFSDPAELISSAHTASVIDAIEASYKPDVILFDLPPVLVVDDTLAFLDQVDCALLVAAAEESTVAEIDRAGKELANGTKVLGVVLNKCRFLDRTEGYGFDDY